MTHSWFKMPTGTAQNPVIGMAARTADVPIPYMIGLFCAAADLYADGKSRDEVREIMNFMFDGGDDKNPVLMKALDEIERRGLLDHEGNIAGIEKSTPTAERMRNYRDRKRNALRNGDVTGDVTQESGDSNALRIDQTRPEREKERTPLPPKPVMVDNSASGKEGSFSRIGDLVGRLGQGVFDIRDHLQDDDYIELRPYMDGWDRKLLFEKYNAFVAVDPPRQPKLAFIGWLKKFTKGRKP